MRWMLSAGCAAALLSAPLGAAAQIPSAEAAAILDEGHARQRVALFDEAADKYEAFARVSPTAPEAAGALKDAVALRLGLGQMAQAQEDADLFARRYGATDPDLASHVSLVVATRLLEKEEPAAARKQLQAWVTAFDARAPLDARLVAHAGLGRALTQLGLPFAQPGIEYGLVRDLWKDPATAAAAVEAAVKGGGPGERDRRLGRSLETVGEALFWFAEQKRLEADQIRMPAYHGRATPAALRRFIGTEASAWMRRKLPALEAVEREYLKVVEIQPVPPPRWVVASANRVGHAWAQLVADFQAIPSFDAGREHEKVPGTSLTYGELRRSYQDALDNASEPILNRARAAFQTCASYAVKYQFESEHTRDCFAWLAAHAGAPRMDEIQPRAAWVGGEVAPAPVSERR